MDIKKGVVLEGYLLRLGDKKKEVAEADMWIIGELMNGTCDEKRFVELVSEREHMDEIDASFRMAVFVEEYGDFLWDKDGGKVVFD